MKKDACGVRRVELENHAGGAVEHRGKRGPEGDFAEQGGKDIVALAACMRADRDVLSASELARSTRPVLVVCGENDDITGPPGPLAAAFADGRAVTVPRRDHMTTVGDKVYKKAVLDFLAE